MLRRFVKVGRRRGAVPDQGTAPPVSIAFNIAAPTPPKTTQGTPEKPPKKEEAKGDEAEKKNEDEKEKDANEEKEATKESTDIKGTGHGWLLRKCGE
jgi:hypothetical protein